MKFWTIQTKDVIERIQEEGIYQPDFSNSRYLRINKNLEGLYSIILRSFNRINKKDLPGVIYAFAQSDNNKIYSIDTFQDFKKFIQTKQTRSDWWILAGIK